MPSAKEKGVCPTWRCSRHESMMRHFIKLGVKEGDDYSVYKRKLEEHLLEYKKFYQHDRSSVQRRKA